MEYTSYLQKFKEIQSARTEKTATFLKETPRKREIFAKKLDFCEKTWSTSKNKESSKSLHEFSLRKPAEIFAKSLKTPANSAKTLENLRKLRESPAVSRINININIANSANSLENRDFRVEKTEKTAETLVKSAKTAGTFEKSAKTEGTFEKSAKTFENPEETLKNTNKIAENSANLLQIPQEICTNESRKGSTLVYESLILSLEEIYREMKKKVLFYQKSIVFLLTSALKPEEKLDFFFKFSLLKVFGVQSFAIYRENAITTIYAEEIAVFETLKKKSLLINSLSMGSLENYVEKEGLFAQKLENEQETLVFYRLARQNSQENQVNYFQLVEKYKFVGFKENLAKFVLLIEKILVKRQINVEIRAVLLEFLALVEYFIINFKVVFLENIKKTLADAFDLEMYEFY